MGQYAFITGASRGIGRGIALALARRGFAIAANAHSDSSALNRTVAEIKAEGVEAVALPGDVTDLGAHADILSRAEDALGPLTTLVNNAGVGPLARADILDCGEASFDHCMATNAKAVFFLTQAFSRLLLQRRRESDLAYSVITISSVSADAASIDKADYCVSKAAEAMVSKVFAVRLAPEGIQVFDIQPGVIETDLSRPVLPGYTRRIETEGLTLIKRVGQPEDVGAVVASAAAGDLPYLAGQVLRVDGGLGLLRL